MAVNRSTTIISDSFSVHVTLDNVLTAIWIKKLTGKAVILRKSKMAIMNMISDPMKINPDFPNEVYLKSFETKREITKPRTHCYKY